MSYLVIHGGKKLKGTLTVHSAKNSAVSILIAAVMLRGTTVLEDVPDIEEVNRIVELIRSIGVSVTKKNDHTYVIDATAPLCMDTISPEACRKTRSSLMLLGALAAREKRYKIYNISILYTDINCIL